MCQMCEIRSFFEIQIYTCVHLQYFEPNSDLHLHTTVKKHSDISNKILILYFCAKSK